MVEEIKLHRFNRWNSPVILNQWFPWKHSNVSDACSWDFHLSDNELMNLFSPLSSLGSIWFQNLSNSRLKSFLADLHVAEAAPNNAVASSHLESIQWIKILRAFAQAVREGRFNTRKSTKFKLDSCQTTLNCMAWPSTWQIVPTQALMMMENLHFLYNENTKDIRN